MRRALGAFALALSAGCEKPATPAAANERGAARSSPFTASARVQPEPAIPPGEVRGEVRFVGEPPARRSLAVSAASGCGGDAPLSDALVITSGGVLNTLVHVRSGLAPQFVTPPTATTVVLDQENCVYSPHVVALRAGQLLEIRTSDGVTHNVNAKPARNERFNLSQTPGAPPLEARFERGELSIPLSCDIHPWMSARVHVLEHQAFALSAADGSFAISGLPPGRYRFEALHEVLGEFEFEVELDGRAGVFVALDFARAGAADK